MYESILRHATGNAEFAFEVTTVPFPILKALEERGTSSLAFNFTFLISIALALIPCAMVSFILREREEALKHM